MTHSPAALAGERYDDNLYYCDDCGQPCEVVLARFVRHHPWGDESYEAPASSCCHGEYQQGCALNFFGKQQERDRIEREGAKDQERLQAELDAINTAWQNCGIAGIADTFHNAVDAIQQMAHRIQELEANEKVETAFGCISRAARDENDRRLATDCYQGETPFGIALDGGAADDL